MRAVREQDWDWLWVTDGRERVGKTAFSTLVLLTAESEILDAVLGADYSIALSRYSWDFDDMLDTVQSLAPGSALCYQEASMLGREAMRTWNLRMVRVMSTIGSRNILYLLTFPRFSMLDPYLRWRTRSRTYVRTHRGVRGWARCYYRARAETDGDDGLRYAFDTMFRDPAKCLPELWAKLREKEDAVKGAILARHGHRLPE